MPVVSSRYWTMVHGNTPDEVRQDEEGMAVMTTLGRNMAWLIKSIAAGRAAGIEAPAPVPPHRGAALVCCLTEWRKSASRFPG